MRDSKNSPSIFSKENYIWMAAGLVLIIIGMFLMSGGTSNSNPTVFDTENVYSKRQITYAPLLILAGLIVEIYAIFKNPKKA